MSKKILIEGILIVLAATTNLPASRAFAEQYSCISNTVKLAQSSSDYGTRDNMLMSFYQIHKFTLNTSEVIGLALACYDVDSRDNILISYSGLRVSTLTTSEFQSLANSAYSSMTRDSILTAAIRKK